jgi:hypothetical protein
MRYRDDWDRPAPVPGRRPRPFCSPLRAGSQVGISVSLTDAARVRESWCCRPLCLFAS